jgi:hypothetical protein
MHDDVIAKSGRTDKPGSEIQNEKIAAFFRVPNVYTSAWLINNPTVMPIVTAIMAPPMSIPLPDAVRPPAWESPDYGTAD